MVDLLDLAVFAWLICWILLCLYGCFAGSECVCIVAMLDLAVFVWLLFWI